MSLDQCRPLASGFLGVALVGCGPNLGTYDVVALEQVDELPPAISHTRDPEPYLRVLLESDFDIAAEGNSNIYSYKHTCGFLMGEGRMIYGPLASGDTALDMLDVGDAMPRNAKGRFSYELHLPVTAETRKIWPNRNEIAQGYDLRVDGEDVCLYIKQSGYFVTESRSEPIKITAKEISAALAD